MTEQERRYTRRLIDLAVERCEERNLREQLGVPRWIADLVVRLQAAAGEELVVPADTIAAHGQLLDLRRGYMPGSSKEDDSERTCASCGRPLRRLSRQADCTECRRLRRLVSRTAAALAS
jgi:hypothetical protein